ncbi:CBS domain-containing protein [Rhodococcus sp. PvR099]|uniref:CBS domain-containing protein n=1 Tax=Rhodococcus sp. PvR099 TaxID=2806602 RepID=UPI001AEA5AA7|nr:CBS domain-containing protein [Rhodococcus sp. PvR099]MBP1159817.1 restriction system protein [Rhodococcus sp. PvR099]
MAGDLSNADRNEIEKRLREHYPGQSNQTIGNWTGQLYRFVNEIRIGDLVTMPLKRGEGGVALGWVESNYQFQPDDDFPHQRAVQWIETPFPRSSFGLDLRASLGSLLTVCGLSRNDAVGRLTSIAETGDDPAMADLADDPEMSLSTLVDNLPTTMTVRRLLEYNGVSRRTVGTVAQIQETLESLGIETDSPIESGPIDREITLRPIPDAESEPAANVTQPTETVPDLAGGADRHADIAAPIHQTRTIDFPVSTIPAASTRPVSVAPDAPLADAQTLMLKYDYSQLAVVEDERLVGSITWQSIAIASFYQKPNYVRDALVSAPPQVPSKEDLLDVVPSVERYGYVWVNTERGDLGGIVTAADLAIEFGRDRKPLMLIEEIELRLRRSVNMLTDQDVAESAARAKTLEALTLGAYPYLLADSNCWGKLSWNGIRQQSLVDLVKQAADIRNSLMHFSPDPISSSDVATLNGLLRILRAVDQDSSD